MYRKLTKMQELDIWVAVIISLQKLLNMLYRFESTVEVPSLAHPSPQMHGTTYAQKSASWSGLFE